MAFEGVRVTKLASHENYCIPHTLTFKRVPPGSAWHLCIHAATAGGGGDGDGPVVPAFEVTPRNFPAHQEDPGYLALVVHDSHKLHFPDIWVLERFSSELNQKLHENGYQKRNQGSPVSTPTSSTTGGGGGGGRASTDTPIREVIQQLARQSITDVVPGIGEHSFVFRDKHITVLNSRMTETGGSFTAGMAGTPKQVVLARNETRAYMLTPGTPGTLYETSMADGRVVTEWTSRKSLPFSFIAASEKGAQSTGLSTLVALTPTSLHRFDARTPEGVVQSATLEHTKLGTCEYRSVKGINCAATCGDGRLAVGFQDGSVRLYASNSLAQAVTHCRPPGLKDAVTSLDVTYDGEWVLATTDHYLWVIPAGESKNSAFNTPSASKLNKLGATRILRLKEVDAGQPLQSAKFTLVTEAGQLERYVFARCGKYSLRWSFRKITAAQVPADGASLAVSYNKTVYEDNLVVVAAMHSSHAGSPVITATQRNLYREADQLPSAG